MPKKKKRAPKGELPAYPRIPGIPASDLLRAESARLKVLQHAVPDAGEPAVIAMAWAFEVSAAWLDSLGAPEKLQRYVPAGSIKRPGDK